MAGLYAPIITVSPTPLISVISAGGNVTSYEEIQESQGTVIYQANEIVYQATTIAQINEPIDVEIYDADGEVAKNKRINVADPNQFQPSKNIDIKSEPLVFNGRTRINLNILPLEDIRLYFVTNQLEPTNFLKGGENFFSEDFLDTYGFFSDYDEEIQEKVDVIREGLENNSADIGC
tara:strand:+ start:584 stop:1114 length:531 start_codon:yes stop_codon:yes gene_type:complete